MQQALLSAGAGALLRPPPYLVVGEKYIAAATLVHPVLLYVKKREPEVQNVLPNCHHHQSDRFPVSVLRPLCIKNDPGVLVTTTSSFPVVLGVATGTASAKVGGNKSA